jgi:hypothetical protein
VAQLWQREESVPVSTSGVTAHDQAVNKAEAARQLAYSIASTQAAIKAADLVFARAAKASALVPKPKADW